MTKARRRRAIGHQTRDGRCILPTLSCSLNRSHIPDAKMLSRTAWAVSPVGIDESRDCVEATDGAAGSSTNARGPGPRPSHRSPASPVEGDAGPIAVVRDQAGDRQSGGICACGALHEGHPGHASVWLLACQHPDPGPAGRRPGQIHRVQRLGRRQPTARSVAWSRRGRGGSDDRRIAGIKEYSEWPTIPQLFVNKQFVGGCDILMSMHQDGQLAEMLDKEKVLMPASAST